MASDTITVQTTIEGIDFGLDAYNRPVSRLSDGRQYGVVLHNPLTGELVGANGASVVGASNSVSSSRTALASDNGATLELENGITYTLDSAVPLPAGVILVGPASGSALLAVAGTATTNAATASITVSAGQIATAIPRASSSSAYIVKVS